MALTLEQLDAVLSYTAFAKYNEAQRKDLRAHLTETQLSYLQLSILFGDDLGGGLIHTLVEDSIVNDESAKQLSKILANVSESINPDYGYSPTPIIEHLLARGSHYDEALAEEVKKLVKLHADISNARILDHLEHNSSEDEGDEPYEFVPPPSAVVRGQYRHTISLFRFLNIPVIQAPTESRMEEAEMQESDEDGFSYRRPM